MSKVRGFEQVADKFRTHKFGVPTATVFNRILIPKDDGHDEAFFVPDIILPTRADPRSAGYDFYVVSDVQILPAHKTIFWTDVKAYMLEDEYLAIHIRSSLGIKQGIILSNVTGIIDSSYYGNEGNDGNIGIALLNTSGTAVTLKAGDRVAQGIFQKYLLADEDKTLAESRTGGTGSSGK